MSVGQFSGGWIEVVAGVMFSGKSEELMRRVRRAIIARKRVQVFKSHLDSRYAGLFSVSSHDGRSVEAAPVDSSAQIAQRIDPTAQVIAVDEAQFLDNGIIDVVTSLAARGRRVILAGLDTDFRGEPFGPMPQLMAIAESVDKLSAICVLCGAPATRTQRLIDGEPAAWNSPTIMVGGREAYEARCRACHVVRPANEGQREFFQPGGASRSNGA
jgi:thymidine kinase